MINDIITELANRGIAHKASQDGIHFFEGMGNKYKASVSFVEGESIQDSIITVIQKINMRQTEWKDIGVEKLEPDWYKGIDPLVPFKTGEQGGYHVMIDGTWMRVRKEP